MNLYAWHFLTADRRLQNGDGRLVVVGRPLTVPTDRPLEPCLYGLHWSEDILDALHYAPGLTLSRVRVGGKIVRESDKGCSTERTAIEIHDVTDIVLEWCRWCAQQVLCLWDAPEDIVRFLETGRIFDIDAAVDVDAARTAAIYAAYAARAAAFAAAAAAYAVAAHAADAARAGNNASLAAEYAACAYAITDAFNAMHSQQREKLLEMLATRFTCLNGE